MMCKKRTEMVRCGFAAFTLFMLTCAASAQETAKLIAPFPGGSGKFTHLVWHDEFDGSGLVSPNNWNYEVGYVRNKELQYYTKARVENASVEDGCLVITARRDSLEVDGKTAEITSASLITRDKHAWLYGRVESRAKVPHALGTWPAIWMMPQKSPYGGWPRGGEIDILEHVGFEPLKVHFNAHTGKYNHTKGTGRGTSAPLKNPQDFHVYAVEWTEKSLDWYLDDKKVFSVANDGTGPDAWPFDHPFYVIVNLAFGGAWGAQKGVDKDALPVAFVIDYVRVFQEQPAKDSP